MELGDNFGGFNYTIPPPFDTVELENIWSELSDIDGGVNTVEILTSGTQLITEEHGGNEDGNLSKISKPKPRRRDYIKDAGERGKYFEEQFQKLTLHFHRTISRTGCEGDLTALFEGRVFNTARTLNPVLSCTMPVISDKSHLDSSQTEHLSPGEVDDHRYAATMLTQKESSSAVTDHQYNEKTFMPINDSDDDEFEEDRPKRKRKRPEPYDYIKVRYARDQTFSKFAKSLFRQKIIIEERTAATVMLSLKYERCSFNEQNYSDAYKIILCSRKPVKVQPPKLAPKKPQNQTPVTFILPRYGPFTLPSSSVPSSPTTSLLMSTSTFSTASASAAGLLVPTSAFSTSESSVGRILLSTDFSSPIINLQTLSEVATATSSNSTSYPEAREQASSALKISTSSRESSPSRGPSPSHASDITDYRDLLALGGSGQQSPELNVSVTKGATIDCSTNTEPICSICQKVGVDDKESSKVFWIRCNDPFCYDMVHASCVGFMITCSSHLKQLPAFYCKAHR